MINAKAIDLLQKRYDNLGITLQTLRSEFGETIAKSAASPAERAMAMYVESTAKPKKERNGVRAGEIVGKRIRMAKKPISVDVLVDMLKASKWDGKKQFARNAVSAIIRQGVARGEFKKHKDGTVSKA